MDTTIQILMKEWPTFLGMMLVSSLIINSIVKKPFHQMALACVFAVFGVLFLHSLYFGG